MTAIDLAILFGIAAATLSAIMSGAWWIQRTTGNSGWVDAIWSFGVGIVGTVCAFIPLSSASISPRQILVALLVAAWCARLGSHIARRTRASQDDPRYRTLMEQWGNAASSRLFWFLQAQAAVGTVLVVAVAAAARNPAAGWHISDAVGFAILLVAVAGEAVSDAQLAAFRAQPENNGRVCDVGIWSWSRHPNYFFEWLAWLAYPIIAVDMSGHYPAGWLALAAPVLMYWVLVHASGIPPLEAHMIRSRGHNYRAYQTRTSAFLPWPPR